MRYYVKINGVSSLTIPGLAIRELPSISKTLMRNQKETIDGRDGDIITELGYSAYDKTLQIGLFGTYDINQIIAFFNQKGTIVFSDEDDKYYNFTILDQLDYDRLVKFRTASVRIHCQPFKYPLTETPIVVEPESVTAEGTNITLNNTGVAKLSVGLKGDTSQETTTGKNLWFLNSSYSYNSSTGNWVLTDTAFIIPAGTYTFSCNNNKAGNTARFQYKYADDVGQYVTFNNSVTITFTEEVKKVALRLDNDTTISNIQLEVGSATSYEPYTGGIPAPNPAFSMPVQVVTGDNTINIVGKNLLNATTNSVTNPANENTITTIGTLSLTAGTTYYISYNVNNSSSTNTRNTPRLVIQGTSTVFYESTSTNYNLTTGRKVWTFNCQTTDTYRLEYWCNNPNTAITVDNFMISTSNDTLYTPYQSQEYEIDLPIENLLNINNSESGGINGTGALITGDTLWRANQYIEVTPNTTYTLSRKAFDDNIQRYLRLYEYNSSQTFISPRLESSTETLTITTGANTKYLKWTIFEAGATLTLDIVKTWELQIEKGSQANKYWAYGTTPIELCKISTYQDYLYKSGENWYKKTYINKITLDGTETGWGLSATDTNTYRFALDNILSDDDKAYSFLTDTFKNNYFQEYAGNTGLANVDTDGIAIRNNFKGFGVRMSKTTVSDLSTFKTWLGTHNTNVHYVLATPTDETITNEALITQLNNLYNNAISYLDQTNLSATGNLPFIMSASALKKGTDEAIINNGGNIYAKPIINIVGDGIVGVSLNGSQILSLDMTTYNDITIDTENMEAYDPNTSQLRNRQVTGDYSKLKLQPGNNTISLNGGFTSATITNWKRWL